MQPQEYYASADVQQGLEALTICPKKSQTEKHCNSCMIACSVVSLAASSLNGDYIGSESCFDLDKSRAMIRDASGYGDLSGLCNGISSGSREQRCRMRTKEREFLPPKTSLARTENLCSHMPWLLKRYYTSDGRLILKEERAKHHKYIQAHRSNSRLTLHLVPLDDDYDDDD